MAIGVCWLWIGQEGGSERGACGRLCWPDSSKALTSVGVSSVAWRPFPSRLCWVAHTMGADLPRMTTGLVSPRLLPPPVYHSQRAGNRRAMLLISVSHTRAMGAPTEAGGGERTWEKASPNWDFLGLRSLSLLSSHYCFRTHPGPHIVPSLPLPPDPQLCFPLGSFFPGSECKCVGATSSPGRRSRWAWQLSSTSSVRSGLLRTASRHHPANSRWLHASNVLERRQEAREH